MLHTTFRKAKEARACIESYKKMAMALGGVKEYGEDTPIPLDKVLEVCGLDDALWSLCIVLEPADREIRLLACDFAEHILPIYEKRYPNDNRPRNAIATSRRFANGEATREELDAACAAAWAARAAARAAWAAAKAAAWAAARAAGREWQMERFLKFLKESDVELAPTGNKRRREMEDRHAGYITGIMSAGMFLKDKVVGIMQNGETDLGKTYLILFISKEDIDSMVNGELQTSAQKAPHFNAGE